MSVRTAQLGDFVRISGGGTPSRAQPEFFNGAIPWVTVKDLGGEYFLRGAQEHISQAGLDGSASRLIPPGNVLLATRMAVGRAVINTVEVAINQDLKALICDPRLHPKYLLFFLTHKAPELEAKATGATVKGVTIDEIESLNIPILNLSEQRRIAGLLEQADRLRRTRRYALEISDSFLLAAFREIFGDPVKNSRGWPCVPISEVGDVQGGLQLSAKRNVLPLKKTFLRVANVQRGFLDLSEVKTIGLTKAEFHRTLLKKNDLLLVEGNGNPSEVGRAAQWNGSIQECVHQNHLIRVRCSEGAILPEFLLALLNGTRGKDYYLKHGHTTSGLVTISTGLVNNFPALLPPIKLQQRFAALAERYEHLQARQREALRQADHLFQSLLHRAFSENG